MKSTEHNAENGLITPTRPQARQDAPLPGFVLGRASGCGLSRGYASVASLPAALLGNGRAWGGWVLRHAVLSIG